MIGCSCATVSPCTDLTNPVGAGVTVAAAGGGADAGGAHLPTRYVSVFKPKYKTRSPAPNWPSPLLSSAQMATPDAVGRTTPILDLLSPFQSPTMKVSLK